MAAGIGEASAILTVAQLGISLSKSLITYIEEVKGAPSHIQRIVNEILTTSERLKDIGDLVDQNSHTKIFNQEGINSAVRCSTECQQIIQDVRIVLCKGGWQYYTNHSDKNEIDTSLFSTLRWPFAKIKLEVPRAELHRIKLDLSLLFSSAMVREASTTVEKQRLAQDIPGIHKARAWAAKRAEQVKEMAQNRSRSSRARDAPWSDDEPEMLEEFVTFKERLCREEEEQRIRERAKMIQAEDDARKRQEEDAQREVERKAIEEYKKQQQEQETRSAEKRDNFRNELERLGLESAQIQVVMESSNLDFQAASSTAIVPEVRPSFSPGELSGELETTPSATSGRSRLSLPWWRSKKSTRESSPEPSLNFMLPESKISTNTKLEIETWLIDVYSNRWMEFLPSADWLIAKLKTIEKDQAVWSRFAKLRPHWRNAIIELLEFRSQQQTHQWTLYHLEYPQKWSQIRVFGQRRDEQLIQLILCRRRVDDEDGVIPRGRPKTEVPGNSLSKHVSFAGEIEEESGTEREINVSSDHVLPRNISDLRERIARLEEKRNRLGVHDQERIGDLNDMISYLRDQLKPDAIHTNALNTTTFHDERQPEPVRSESVRAPTIIREEYIPYGSRRDDMIRLNNRSDRGPSPPRRRSSNADDITLTNHRPRVTHDDIEIIKIESSPEKTDYEGRHGVRNNSRYEPREHRRSYRDDDEDITVRRRIYPHHDRSSQIGWRERSRSRSHPSRQDSTDTRGGPVIFETRDRSWERSKSRPSRASRQPPKEIDYDAYFEERMAGDDRIRPSESTRQREEAAWSPERQGIVIRRNERSKSRPRGRQNVSSSGSEHSYSGSRVGRGQPILEESGQGQALVLRAGASGLPYDYIRGRVLNGGIRVRGDDDIGSPRPGSVISQHHRRPSRPPTSRRSSYRDQSWAPSLRRRLSETWRQFESSEDDEYRYQSVNTVDSEKKASETELSDAEVIAQTLKKFTTIQDSDMPSTGIVAPPVQKKRASEAEVGPSALKNTSHASLGPERKKSLPVPGRKARFEQDNEIPQPDQEGQSGATKGGSKLVDEGPFLDKISEEPDVMIEDNDIPHHQRVVYFPERPVFPRPPQRPSFPFPPDLAHHSREASPRPHSRSSTLDSPRSRPANAPIIIEHGGYTLTSQGEIPNPLVQEEGYDEVENIRQISRNPTVQEEVE